jgi:hypothetical protein
MIGILNPDSYFSNLMHTTEASLQMFGDFITATAHASGIATHAVCQVRCPA